jgi:peptidoglycan/xylan/chitin deacetylase (PgdA/CDA1 family)
VNVAVTFDNLGGTDEPERDRWHAGLPRVLRALQEARLRATFFVEGVNAGLHPDTLRELAAAGHEVALHGWRHEPWAELEEGEERELLERATHALGGLGLAPVGFRPPGGGLTRSTPALLAGLGFSYCSPVAGDTPPAGGGLAMLPFRWELVDATYYLPRFADLRERVLGVRVVQPPERLRDAVAAALAAGDGDVVLVFHAFLAVEEERLELIRDTLARVRALIDAGTARSAPCRELAGR